MINFEERFWSKVDRSGGPDACWPWTKCVDKNGYGRSWFKSGYSYSHRIAFALANDLSWPLPVEVQVLHHCDFRLCCNPKCLFSGDNAANVADRVAKGRSSRGEGRPTAKLTEVDVLEIRRLVKDRYYSHRELFLIGRRFGVSHQAVRAVVKRQSWAWLSET